MPGSRSLYDHGTNLLREPVTCGMKTEVVLAASLGLWAVGCVELHPSQSDRGVPYAEIYQRATNEFACAAFFKPTEAGTNTAGFPLAPLILQQTAGPLEHPALPDQFGALTFSNGAPVLDVSRPTIYWDADTVQINGTAHTRLSYAWCYFAGPGDTQHAYDANATLPAGAKPGLAVQGIRVTLNSAGHPAIAAGRLRGKGQFVCPMRGVRRGQRLSAVGARRTRRARS